MYCGLLCYFLHPVFFITKESRRGKRNDDDGEPTLTTVLARVDSWRLLALEHELICMTLNSKKPKTKRAAASSKSLLEQEGPTTRMQPFRGLRHGLLIAAAAFRSRGCGRRSSSSYSSPFVLCWSLLRTTWFTKGISSMQQSLGPNTVLLSWTLNKKWTEHIAAVLYTVEATTLLLHHEKTAFDIERSLLRKKAWTSLAIKRKHQISRIDAANLQEAFRE